MKNLLFSLFAVIALAFASCASKTSTTSASGTPAPTTPASVQVAAYAPLIQTAATVATSEVLAQVKTPAKQKQDADYIYSVAVGLRTLSGTTPTAADVQSTLSSFGAPSDPQISALVESLTQLYSTYYTQYSGTNDGVKTAAIILESLAQGAEAGASAYK